MKITYHPDRKPFIDSVFQTEDIARFSGWEDVDSAASFQKHDASFWLRGYRQLTGSVSDIEAHLGPFMDANAPAGKLIINTEPDYSEGAKVNGPSAMEVHYDGPWNPAIAAEFQVALLGLAGVLAAGSQVKS